MESHEWNERGAEGVRYYRATYHGRSWVVRTTLKTDPAWQALPAEAVTPELWASLREVLWRRYQRRRGSWERIEAIDRYLAGEAEAPYETLGQTAKPPRGRRGK